MSMYNINSYELVSDEDLKVWADSRGITLAKARSLVNNTMYRKLYRKDYNKRDYVKDKRAELNQVEYFLRKSLSKTFGL